MGSCKPVRAITMHQFLIQWVDDEVEVIHADNSACVALADASVDWQHPNATCLTGRDLSEFDFLSATKNGFVPVSLKPAECNRLQGMICLNGSSFRVVTKTSCKISVRRERYV